MAAIILQFGANTERAKSAMQQLASTVATNMSSVASVMGSTALTTTAATSAMGQGFGAAALAAGRFIVQYRQLLFALTAVGIGIAAANRSLDELVAIGDKAAKVKLSPEFFQAFIREAERVRITTKEAEAALAAFAAATKPKFDAADRERPNQPSQIGKLLEDLVLVQNLLKDSGSLDRFLNAANQNETLVATIDLIRELQNEGQKLAALNLAETAFGKDGEKFAEQIEKGKFALENVNKEGRNTGVIFSNELVAAAVELRNRLQAAGNEIRDNLKPILQGSVTVALVLGSAFVAATEGVAALLRGVNAVYQAILGAAAAAASLVRALGQTPEGVAGLEAKAERRRNLDRAIREDSGGQVGALSPLEAAKAKIAAGLGSDLGGETTEFGRNVNKALGGEDEPRGVIVQLPPNRPPGLGEERSRSRSRSGGPDRDERLEAVKAYIEQLEKANRLARAEVEAFGKGVVEREKALALARLGVEATEQERQKIEQVADSTGRYKQQLEELELQKRRNAEAARYFGDVAVDALTDLIIEGRAADEVLKNIGKSLASSALRSLLTGQGPFAAVFGAPAAADGSGGGIIGALFKGLTGRAGGGSIFGGAPVLVGESGPEVFLPGQSGTIIPNRLLSGGSAAVTNQFVFNAPGADAAQLRALQVQVAQMEASMNRRIVATMREQQVRGVRA